MGIDYTYVLSTCKKQTGYTSGIGVNRDKERKTSAYSD